ncbi:hypothetical protein GQ54DRAFT_317550 [Martensiomyces pterosporus]|nr:hypothetical protein GQ54DRAFT_317550 [Martensiomyces pterosporus]
MVVKSKGGLVVAYDGKAVLFREYEVLCGSTAMVKWVAVHGKLEAENIKGAKPLQCGKEKSGEPLFAARTSAHGKDYGGKVSRRSKGILFPHDGREDKNKDYLVLCEL